MFWKYKIQKFLEWALVKNTQCRRFWRWSHVNVSIKCQEILPKSISIVNCIVLFVGTRNYKYLQKSAQFDRSFDTGSKISEIYDLAFPCPANLTSLKMIGNWHVWKAFMEPVIDCNIIAKLALFHSPSAFTWAFPWCFRSNKTYRDMIPALQCVTTSISVKVWKWKCESVKVNMWKWKCESEHVKVRK